MATISSPGTGSGIDISGLVSQILNAEAEPTLLRLNGQEARFQAQISANGSLKSALSGFNSSLASLKDLSDFQLRSAQSADTDLFTVSATSSAAPATYDVEVVTLASAHKLAATGFSSSSDVVGSGTLNITSGSENFSVSIPSSAKTLADIRSAINDASGNTSVSATIVTVDDGSGGNESRLVLSANGSGTDNSLRLTVVDDDGNHTDSSGLSQLVYDPLPLGSGTTNLTQLSAAVDAQIKVDTQTITRSTNSIGDAIEGVTIDLLKVSAAPGATTELSVSLDSAAVSSAVQSFVSSYNSLRSTINDLSVFDAQSGARGILLGDATLRGISSQIQRELGSEVSGINLAFNSLVEIGITTQADGSLKLDSSVLNTALDTDFDAVGDLFASNDGIATRLDSVLDGFLKFDGALDSRNAGLSDRIDEITRQRELLDQRLLRRESRLLAQFNAMDALVNQLQSTTTFLNQQLTALQGLTINQNNQ